MYWVSALLMWAVNAVCVSSCPGMTVNRITVIPRVNLGELILHN